MLTFNKLSNLVNDARKLIQEWDLTEEVRRVTDGIMDAINQLDEATQTDEIADDAKELALAVDDFIDQYNAWKQIDYASHGEHPQGTQDMWEKWRIMLTKLTPPTRRLPPTVAYLRSLVPPTGDTQICRMYRWLDAHGRPDTQKLREHCDALANGEKSPHYDPKTFMSAADERRMEATNKKWKGREQRMRAAGRVMKRANEQKKKQPPSLEFLAKLPGMTYEQIARMHQISRGEVVSALEEMGLYLDATGLRHFDPGTKDSRNRQQEDTELSEIMSEYSEMINPDLGTDWDAHVLHLNDQNMKPATIAKVVTSLMRQAGENRSMTFQKAGKIIKNADNAPVA